jgi:PPP family 3-phenylpropionic acid transporter
MVPAEHRFSKSANALHYILYFAVMGMYLPYFNLYCYHLGFSGFNIGVLSALRALAMVISPMAWGALADRSGGRRPIYILCTAVSAGIWVFFLFTEDFAVMAALTLLYGIFYAPVISFLEALTMESLGGEKQRYGRIRAWGSISFIAVVLVFGRLIEHFSVRLIVSSILIGSVALAILALKVPASSPGPKKSAGGETRAWLRPQVFFFLACGFLMLVSHGAYYGFFSIHLENLGYSSTFIGMNWALASVAEIGVMVFSGALFGASLSGCSGYPSRRRSCAGGAGS